MIKNQAGTVKVFAFNRSTGAPVTGDAANITCQYDLDRVGLLALADATPDETELGFYVFNVTAAECNGTTVDFYPESSTSGVQVIVVEHDRYLTASTSGIAVLPASMSQPKRIDGTEIVAFINENLQISPSVYDIENDPVDLSAITLKFVISTKNEVHVLTIPDADITVSGADNNVFTLTLPDTFTDTLGAYRYSLRNSSTDVVLAQGDLLVRYAATE